MARPSPRRPLASVVASPATGRCSFCALPEDVRAEVDAYLSPLVEAKATGQKAPIARKALLRWIRSDAGCRVSDHHLQEHLGCLANP